MRNNMREDWIEVELGEVCEDVLKVKRNEMDDNDSFLYFDIGGIDNKSNKIVSYKNYKWKDAPSRAQQIIKFGDTLFSTVRTYLKNIAIVDNVKFENEVCSSGFTVIRGKKDILHSKYINYYSLSEVFLQPLNELQQGSSYPAVRDKDVFSQIVPLAPLPIQRAIVSKIEALFSDLDNGIANFKKAQAQLKIYRQAVLKKAFEGELTKVWREQQSNLPTAEELKQTIEMGRQKFYNQQLVDFENALKLWEKNGRTEKKPSKPSKLTIPDLPNAEHEYKKWSIPEYWTWTQIGTICFVTKLAGFEYTDYVKYDNSGDLTVLKAENAGLNGFKKTNYSKIKSETVQVLKRSFLYGGELLIVFVGAGTGNVAVVPHDKKYFLGPNIGMARPYFEMNSRYLEFLLQSSVGKGMLMVTAKAVAQPSLSMGTIRQTPVAFPSINEQNEIVQEIESRLSVCDKMEQSITESIAKAEALRQSILKKAFEGKLLSPAEIDLCKQEVDYEPASVLLEKIKAEKLTKESKQKNPNLKKKSK